MRAGDDPTPNLRDTISEVLSAVNTSPVSGGERNPVEALAEEFLDRQRRGERPSLGEYLRLHPELADDIRDLFPVLIRMEDLGADSSGISTGDNGPARSGPRPERLGDFRLLREVGRGGMGVVYEAEQESLGRRVALKVLPDAALSDSRQVLRFQREAKAAARLHHTNIVPVFGVGQDAGRHYYVMQFIPGMGLDAVLDELRRLRRGWPGATPRPPGGAATVAEAILTGRFSRGGDPPDAGAPTVAAPISPSPDPDRSSVNLPGASASTADHDRPFFRSVANIGRQVADALEYANRQGVLHRDVKPSNLLLDPRGNVWVADFGLAKASDTVDLTDSGDVIGTLRYMAPERFAGRCDARSDVYSLGLTLYEILSLRPAFEAPDRHALMRLVMGETPEPLRKLVPNLPRDLGTIVAKATAREPAQRYTTAAELAEDLQLFLDDRPIRARRVTASEQAWRWARRNPAVAALAAGLLGALVAGMAGVTLAWREASANNRKAEARSRLAMEAVRSFTSGASEDVLLREKQLSRLRNKLLEGSLTFYDRLAGLLTNEKDVASRRSLAQAIFDAAELNGRIGRRDKALEAHRKALALREELAKGDRSDVEVRREVGLSELAVGEALLSVGRHAEARVAFARSRAVAEELASEALDDAGSRVLLADGLLAEGDSYFEELRLAEARSFLERALETYDRLVRQDEDNGPANVPERYLRGRAKCLHKLAQWGREHGQPAGTTELLERATADYEALTRRFPGDIDLWLALADCHAETAAYLKEYADNPHARARQQIRRAKAIYDRLAHENPTVTEIRVKWAWYINSEGNNPGPGATREEIQERLREGEHAVAVCRELSAADPHVPSYETALAASLWSYGAKLFNMGRRDEGLARMREGFELVEKTGLTPEESFIRGRQQLSAGLTLAASLAMTGRVGEALQILRKAIAMEEAYVVPRSSRWLMIRLALCYELRSYLEFGTGLRAEAVESAERAATMLEPLTDPIAQETWDMAALHLLWYMQGRRAAPGRPAELPGRPEHAAQALGLLRRAAERGCIETDATRAFFGPVMGHLPEFRRLMMDLSFPIDPFQSVPAAEDAGGQAR